MVSYKKKLPNTCDRRGNVHVSQILSNFRLYGSCVSLFGIKKTSTAVCRKHVTTNNTKVKNKFGSNH